MKKILSGLIYKNCLLRQYERESNKPNTEVLDQLSQNHIWFKLLMDRKGLLTEGYGNYRVDKSFQLLIESHIHLEATVPHDRIYRLIALAGKGKIILSKPPAINYAESEFDVKISWAKWMIEQSKSLEILSACQKTVSEEGLPSWVPSWKARSDESFIPRFLSAGFCFHASSIVFMVRNNNKQITTSSARFLFSEDNHLLSVQGKLIATLDNSYHFTDIQPDYHRKMLEFLPAGYISGEPQSVWQDITGHNARRQAIKFPLAASWQIPLDYAAARKRTPARLEN